MSSTRTWEEVSCTGGLQGQGSGPRGVNLSVAVSFVLFWFPFSFFPCTTGVGWLVLWRCVLMWVQVARESEWGVLGCGSTGGDDGKDLLSSFASRTRERKRKRS